MKISFKMKSREKDLATIVMPSIKMIVTVMSYVKTVTMANVATTASVAVIGVITSMAM